MSLSTLRFRRWTLPFLCIVSLLALEVGIRIYVFGISSLSSPSQYDPLSLTSTEIVNGFSEKKLGWKLKPDLQTFYKGKPFQTNSHGFRDRERKVKKEGGVHRIAVLGRSYAMGTGVANSEAWPMVLDEQYFNSSKAKEVFGEVEVLNFSVEAYSMLQVEDTFHRFAKNFQPDFVLVPIFYEEIDALVPLVPKALPSGIIKWSSTSFALDHFYFPRFIQSLIWQHILVHTSQDWGYLYQQGKGQRLNVSSARYISVIQQFLNSIREEGSRVILVPMPRLIASPPVLYVKGKRLFEEYVRNKPWIILLNETEDLRSVLTSKDLAIPGDPHFNANFHKLLADRIYQSLSKRRTEKPTLFWK